ncbi:hypothetical protein PGB90_007411 [Kerria lacca]
MFEYNWSELISNENGDEDKIFLLCHKCKDSFESAWDLIVHVQSAHMMNVYELGTPKSKNDQPVSPSSTKHFLENGFAETPNLKNENLSFLDDDHQPLNLNSNEDESFGNETNCFMLTSVTNGSQ